MPRPPAGFPLFPCSDERWERNPPHPAAEARPPLIGARVADVVQVPAARAPTSCTWITGWRVSVPGGIRRFPGTPTYCAPAIDDETVRRPAFSRRSCSGLAPRGAVAGEGHEAARGTLRPGRAGVRCCGDGRRRDRGPRGALDRRGSGDRSRIRATGVGRAGVGPIAGPADFAWRRPLGFPPARRRAADLRRDTFDPCRAEGGPGRDAAGLPVPDVRPDARGYAWRRSPTGSRPGVPGPQAEVDARPFRVCDGREWREAAPRFDTPRSRRSRL
jgi:hypothetical protein